VALDEPEGPLRRRGDTAAITTRTLGSRAPLGFEIAAARGGFGGQRLLVRRRDSGPTEDEGVAKPQAILHARGESGLGREAGRMHRDHQEHAGELSAG